MFSQSSCEYKNNLGSNSTHLLRWGYVSPPWYKFLVHGKSQVFTRERIICEIQHYRNNSVHSRLPANINLQKHVLTLIPSLNLPQFVLVANYYLREPRFVYRSCFRYQCCRHSWVLIGSEGAGKMIKTKYWSQSLPAREKKSDYQDGQDCHRPKKSSKRGSARKMGPAMQGGAFAEMREHVHRSYCGVPGRLHHGWLGVFLVLPSPGY